MPKFTRFQLGVLAALQKIGESVRGSEGGPPEISVDLLQDYMDLIKEGDGLRIEMELWNLADLGYVTVKDGTRFMLNAHRYGKPR